MDLSRARAPLTPDLQKLLEELTAAGDYGSPEEALRAAKAELRALISPFALLTPSGFRRRARLQPHELGRLAMPTLVIWGERDPLGGVPVAQELTRVIPHAHLEILPTGHGPWLGRPVETATAITDFLR